MPANLARSLPRSQRSDGTFRDAQMAFLTAGGAGTDLLGGLRPPDASTVFVPAVDEAPDRFNQVPDRGEDAAANGRWVMMPTRTQGRSGAIAHLS
jgi:hypothetical protein